jgi:uncharacterized protein
MAEYLNAGVFVTDNDPAHREYLEHQASGTLHLQHCEDCRLLIYPVRSMCPDCSGSNLRWKPLSGRGVIYSYYVVPHPIHPAFRGQTPYPVALIELDEQRGVGSDLGDRILQPNEHRAIRMIGNIVRPDGSWEDRDNIAIGKRVEVHMVDLGDGWALPQWRLSDEPTEGAPWQIPRPHD